MKLSMVVKCKNCGYETEGEAKEVSEGSPEIPEYCMNCNEYIG